MGDLLLHRAGLLAWKPFYVQTLESLKPGLPITRRKAGGDFSIDMGGQMFMNRFTVPASRYYRSQPEGDFPIAVAHGLYGKVGMRDSLLNTIYHTPRRKGSDYLYSDWGFILLQQLLERINSRSLDDLASRELFGPLGMTRTMYTPWRRGYAAHCAPSEYDQFFRKAIVQGYVHDMAAAMMGGVAGHAGLFSTADDVAKYGFMLSNRGWYGGMQYLQAATVELFTRPPKGKKGYRGYGFDMVNPAKRQGSYVGESLPLSSYGHIGFTGTILWIDPDTEFVFVLLSNRTFPDSNNQRINSRRIRARIMQALYESVSPRSGQEGNGLAR